MFIMIMISNFLFDFINFCVIFSFFTKLLTLGFSFSTAVRTVVEAKLVILGILPLTSFILALRAAVVAKLVILGSSSDCNWTRTHNHLVRKRTLNHLGQFGQMAECSFTN